MSGRLHFWVGVFGSERGGGGGRGERERERERHRGDMKNADDT